LNVLVLTTSYPSDDTDPSGIFIAKLLRAIRKRGHAVKVVAPTNGRFHGRRTIDGIETVRFGYFIPRSAEKLTTELGGIPETMAKSRLARLQLFPMMARFLISALGAARGCDIVYANWLGAGLVGAAVKVVTGKPLVVSFRGDDGYLARDRQVWRVPTCWVMRNADKVAPVSRQLGDILVSLGLPEEKCRIPRFGVDVEMFYPGERQTSDDVRILYVGALIRKKGVADLLEAISEGTSPHCRLIAVGDGVEATELKALADRLGLKDRVEWKGLQPHEEVARMMRECDLLCLPSYTEGRPNVVVEAMASGLPVIATNVGGIPDLVREDETALLHEPGDVAALRNCLNILAEKPDVRIEMGRKGRALVMESGLNWDTTALDFEEIFTEAVRSRQARKTT
jgi:glycosyltransferase involved in cell wall biosynthesis